MCMSELLTLLGKEGRADNGVHETRDRTVGSRTASRVGDRVRAPPAARPWFQRSSCCKQRCWRAIVRTAKIFRGGATGVRGGGMMGKFSYRFDPGGVSRIVSRTMLWTASPAEYLAVWVFISICIMNASMYWRERDVWGLYGSDRGWLVARS